jgi:hypothetical protein
VSEKKTRTDRYTINKSVCGVMWHYIFVKHININFKLSTVKKTLSKIRCGPLFNDELMIKGKHFKGKLIIIVTHQLKSHYLKYTDSEKISVYSQRKFS